MKAFVLSTLAGIFWGLSLPPFPKAPLTNDLGYYGYNETLNAYYEIISYAKLLADAKKRNRILFEKLHLPISD